MRDVIRDDNRSARRFHRSRPAPNLQAHERGGNRAGGNSGKEITPISHPEANAAS
jgi:hypothetical protein